MTNSFQLLEVLTKRPLEAVVAILLGATVWLAMFAMQAKVVHAEQDKDQEVTEKYQLQQDTMMELVIRIDENVKQLKDK